MRYTGPTLVIYGNSRDMEALSDNKYMATRDIGNMGEDVACVFLKKKGFSIIGRNYSRPWGEIDIIAKKDGCIRFIEVKSVVRETLPDVSRESSGYRPEEQVHPTKLRKIARTAETYMAGESLVGDFQIDVVAVFLDVRRKKARCRLLENVL